ncbi:MAG TPA: glycosyltransferase family 4 protein [Candidatus Nanopelagicales bacterium]|nr:glycosyltransferase family 4 protein [Candidatus Nanopelagicales bacterium]
MRILILTWRDLQHPLAGGAEVYTEQVAKRWAAKGHQVTLFAAAVEDRPVVEDVDGYTVVRGGSRYTVYRRARVWWQQVGQYQGFDLVIDMINTVAFQAHDWIEGVPTVGFIHQTCEEIWAHNAPWPASLLGRHYLEPKWLRSYQGRRVLAVSQSTKDSIARFGVTDVTVVPEGFDPPAVIPDVPKADRPTLVWCARHVPYKRPIDAIEAFTIAREQVPDLQLWMLGGGPDLEKTKAAAVDGVTVFGRVSEQEKVERMAAAHVHVATSVREGWGLVVSEAAAVGTPTISYDVPGLRDSTRAANGVVVPATPMALGDWIPTMLRTWQQEPMEPLAYGGAHSWDFVADQVFTEATKVLKPGLRLVSDAA